METWISDAWMKKNSTFIAKKEQDSRTPLSATICAGTAGGPSRLPVEAWQELRRSSHMEKPRWKGAGQRAVGFLVA